MNHTYRPNSLQHLTAVLFRPVDAAFLACFRMAFGAVVTVFAVKMLVSGAVSGLYIQPTSHFYYGGFEWVRPWPGSGMYIQFVVLGVLALMVTVGLFYRVASVALAVAFTYVFLLDRSYYLNHYYLMCLLCWMMVILPAQCMLSFDALGNRGVGSPTVPAWTLWLVRFHIALPYFFGGVAKIDADWLQGQPMRMTLSSQPWWPSVTQWVAGENIVRLFSWGGLAFDLLIVPALLWRQTRMMALAAAVLFHLTNAAVFPIGVFPWLMIAATLVFLLPDWPRRMFGGRGVVLPPTPTVPDEFRSAAPLRRKCLIVGLSCYVLFHVGLPLRHLVLPGNASWTEQGHCFSWHMLLRGKQSGLRMYVTDPKSGRTGTADLRRHVTVYQLPKVSRDPEHIRQLAHHVADHHRKTGHRNVEVRAFALVSLNGRKPQLMVDPTVDLASQPASWSPPEWILPLTEPLRHDHWEVPLGQWERTLGLDAESALSVCREAGRSRADNAVEVLPGQAATSSRL